MTGYLSFIPGKTPTFFDVARGKVAGARLIRKMAFGSIPISATRDCWADSTNGNQPALTADTALEIVSSSTSDTAAGTGARTVTIEALKADLSTVTFTVTMNGQTPVALPQNVMRIQTARVASAGSGQGNAGNVDIRTVSGSTVQCRISGSTSRENELRYTCPAGKVAFVYRVVAGTEGIAKASEFLGWVGEQVGATPADLIYFQQMRFMCAGLTPVLREPTWEVKLEAGDTWKPSIKNSDGTNAILWTGEIVIVEMDAA